MSIPVVYDTMLYFQAACRPNRIHATFQAVLDNRLTLYLSGELLAEVCDVLTRPEHEARFPALTPEAVEAFLADVVARAVIVDPVPKAFTWPEHSDDDHVFNLTIAAGAQYLVTWETRILNLVAKSTSSARLLHQLAPNLRIVTPAQLAKLLADF